MSIKQLSKIQKIRLCLGVVIIGATFIYSCVNYPRLMELAYSMGIETDLTLGQRLFFQWSWLITLLPLVLGVLIYFTYKHKEKLGTALLIFSIASAIVFLPMVFYLKSATQQPVLSWEESMKEMKRLSENEVLDATKDAAKTPLKN